MPLYFLGIIVCPEGTNYPCNEKKGQIEATSREKAIVNDVVKVIKKKYQRVTKSTKDTFCLKNYMKERVFSISLFPLSLLSASILVLRQFY